jgi:UDP-N-acetylglucosamine--N-acetylmuramyl-(pentapeptide) pyrophosphoryl-undecaprenol N-acetylglucosamine transferase
VFVGQKGDPLTRLPAAHPSIDEVKLISAGKFRRYHGEGVRQLLHAPTVAKNFRDFFKVAGGAGQAYRLLGKVGAKVVYTPGGYVGVPVGMAAARRGIPVLTHDLDALPGLANRINARWAARHITALPPEMYTYPVERVVYAGVPVAKEFQIVTSKLQQEYRHQLGIAADAQVLFIIGGGLGAQRINTAMLKDAKQLIEALPKLLIIHVAGTTNQQTVSDRYDQQLSANQRQRVQVMGFTDDVCRYSGAADLVITRAGATNMAEFENQHKACIVIPSAVLSGGHQVKNVQRWVDAHAVALVSESELIEAGILFRTVHELMTNPQKLAEMGNKLGAFAKPDAAKTVALTILDVLDQKRRKGGM